MKHKISIIIPCYNQSAYLEKCLYSVQSQNYQNWECIMIDDGSSDNTREIAENWAQKDARFIYFHKENGGVSSARNVGIDKSSGEFIYFLDSDDYLFNELVFHNFANEMNDEELDVINANFYFVDEKGKLSHSSEKETILQRQSLENEEILKKYILKNISGIGCNKMFRREFLFKNNFRFYEKMHYSEDFMFLLNVFSKARKMVNIPAYTYCYNRANPNSSTATASKKFTEKWYDSQMILIKNIAQLINTSPRWKLIDNKLILQYFAHQYHFLKDPTFISNQKIWKKRYTEVQKIYHRSLLHGVQKRFRYNATLTYFAYTKLNDIKNKDSFLFKLMCKFVTF